MQFLTMSGGDTYNYPDMVFYSEIKKHSGYSAFMTVAKGRVYERWVKSTLGYDLPYSEGFMIIDNKIYSTAEDWQ